MRNLLMLSVTTGLAAGCAMEATDEEAAVVEEAAIEAAVEKAAGPTEGAGVLMLTADGKPTSDLEAAACIVYANTPYRSSNWIEATGGRTGCPNTVNLHVRIREDLPWQPDDTLAESFFTGPNFDAFLSFPCFGFGNDRTVFTETIINGQQKVQSSRVKLYCD